MTGFVGSVVLVEVNVVWRVPEMEGGLRTARATSNRMMSWGLLSGVILGALQIAALPVIFKATPMPRGHRYKMRQSWAPS